MSALTKGCGICLLNTTAKRRPTRDQEIPYQQNLDGRRISILILCAPTNRLADLKRLVPAALLSLNSIQPGQVIRLE